MNVRKLALETLVKCETAAQYANLALDAKIKKYGLSGDDRSLFTVLVYGTIEHKLTLDYYIDALSTLPKSKIDAETRNILRLGLYQVIFMRTATHAAVNETVELAPMRSRGFVNAILRSYIRKKDSLSLPDPDKDAPNYLSIKYSYPLSTVEKLISVFGLSEAETLLSAMDSAPPITLRVNTQRISREELLEKLTAEGIDAEVTPLAPFGIRLNQSVPYSRLEESFKGEFFIQDEASQISVAALDPHRGHTLMDICSCPGSKSFGAALTMENEGKIFAYDLSKSKLPLISSGAERLGIRIITAEVHDGRQLIDAMRGKSDRIICDVPCSGFGVTAKKPDIRYKDIKDTAALPGIQYDILCTASEYLKKDGIMIYSTCTILPEENEENVIKFLSEHKDFELVPFKIGSLNCNKGYVTLLPHIHNTDGFFVAKLRRKS